MSFHFAYREGGDCVAPVKEYPAAGSKTFVKGEAVNLESGLLDNGAAADLAFVGVTNETVSSATVEGTPVEVILALEDVVFEVDYTGSVKTFLTNTDIGTAFDLDSLDPKKINLDDTTGGAWVVVGFDNDKGVAYVKLKAANRAAVLG